MTWVFQVILQKLVRSFTKYLMTASIGQDKVRKDHRGRLILRCGSQKGAKSYKKKR